MVIRLGFQIGSAMQEIASSEDNGTTGALKVMSSPHPMWAILEFLFWVLHWKDRAQLDHRLVSRVEKL